MFGTTVAPEGVASYTEAWIETLCDGLPLLQGAVASYTEAWIETGVSALRFSLASVASYTEAWIETKMETTTQKKLEGRLLHGGVD